VQHGVFGYSRSNGNDLDALTSWRRAATALPLRAVVSKGSNVSNIPNRRWKRQWQACLFPKFG